MLRVLPCGYLRRPRRLSLVAAILLGGCGARWNSYIAQDTVCLNKQVYARHLPMDRALTACGTTVPDLTGDKNLQQVAMSAGVKFRVDPNLDGDPKAAGETVLQPGAHFAPIY